MFLLVNLTSFYCGIVFIIIIIFCWRNGVAHPDIRTAALLPPTPTRRRQLNATLSARHRLRHPSKPRPIQSKPRPWLAPGARIMAATAAPAAAATGNCAPQSNHRMANGMNHFPPMNNYKMAENGDAGRKRALPWQPVPL